MPTVQETLLSLRDQQFTAYHLAVALGCDHDTIRQLIANPDAPISEQARHEILALTGDKVAARNHLSRRSDVIHALGRLQAEGCQIGEIATSVPCSPLELTSIHQGPPWVPNTHGVGALVHLTIDDIIDPHVPADLTYWRIRSLETMGWTPQIIATTLDTPLPQTPDGMIPRGTAAAVAAFWESHSARLNTTHIADAERARATGIRTPADWEPPTQALWWVKPHLRRYLAGGSLNFACGPTPIKD